MSWDNYISLDASPRRPTPVVTELYVAGALLVLAQIVGIYGLKTRKADVLFSVLMVVLVAAAVAIGIFGALARIHNG